MIATSMTVELVMLQPMVKLVDRKARVEPRVYCWGSGQMFGSP